ncbi:hypothetical protein, partial [Escherichia coli]
PSETMIWQPEFTDKTLSRKPGAVHDLKLLIINNTILYQHRYQHEKSLVFGIEPGQSGPD